MQTSALVRRLVVLLVVGSSACATAHAPTIGPPLTIPETVPDEEQICVRKMRERAPACMTVGQLRRLLRTRSWASLGLEDEPP